MINVSSVFLIFVYFTLIISGHGFNKLRRDADLQAALMPQELNPTFVSDKMFQDAPWRAVFPLVERQRRDVDVVADSAPHVVTVSQNIKLYSRIATCVALAFAAIVEIILYVVEFYSVT